MAVSLGGLGPLCQPPTYAFQFSSKLTHYPALGSDGHAGNSTR